MTQGMMNASFLIDDRDFALYDDDVVKAIKIRWRSHATNAALHNKLFESDLETRETTLSYLQAMCQSVIKQIDRNSVDYLPGGCHYELIHKVERTPEEEKELHRLVSIPLTTDLMEGLFSYMDYDCTVFANTQLGTASGMTAFRANKTMEWYHGLTKIQQECSCNLMRRLSTITISRMVAEYKSAREVRLEHLVTKADKAAERRRNFLKKLMQYEDSTIFFTVKADEERNHRPDPQGASTFVQDDRAVQLLAVSMWGALWAITSQNASQTQISSE